MDESKIDMNVNLFRLINDAHSNWADIVIGIVSGLGDGLVVALCCAVLMMYRFGLGMAATLAFIVSGLLAQLLKRLFDMPRPPAVLEQVHLLGASLQSHSFPSGHSTSAGVMVLLAFLIWRRSDWQAYLMAGLFLLAAYGRIYGGVHFPLDVVVGLFLGMLCMWFFYKLSKSWPIDVWQNSDWSWRIVGMIVLIEATVLGLGYHVQPATSQALAAVLPLAALLLLVRFWKRQVKDE
ncbi:MAG: phosphatase PAP2 family protein [Mariprofundaceae bacterium]